MSGLLFRLRPEMTDEEWRRELEQAVVDLVDRHPELEEEGARVLLASRKAAAGRDRKETTMYRQGDVLLVPTKLPRQGLKAVRRSRRGLVLAEGEATGHAHAILDRGAELYIDEASEPVSPETTRAFLRVLAEGGVALVHQEHETIVLPPGDYEVRRQREYAPEEIRQVAD